MWFSLQTGMCQDTHTSVWLYTNLSTVSLSSYSLTATVTQSDYTASVCLKYCVCARCFS